MNLSVKIIPISFCLLLFALACGDDDGTSDANATGQVDGGPGSDGDANDAGNRDVATSGDAPVSTCSRQPTQSVALSPPRCSTATLDCIYGCDTAECEEACILADESLVDGESCWDCFYFNQDAFCNQSKGCREESLDVLCCLETDSCVDADYAPLRECAQGDCTRFLLTCFGEDIEACSCDASFGCDADCDCDLDCEPTCACDTSFSCDAGCECDTDCAAGCACDTSASCQAGCECDTDCPAGCGCDATSSCDFGCSCDADCQIDFGRRCNQCDSIHRNVGNCLVGGSQSIRDTCGGEPGANEPWCRRGPSDSSGYCTQTCRDGGPPCPDGFRCEDTNAGSNACQRI